MNTTLVTTIQGGWFKKSGNQVELHNQAHHYNSTFKMETIQLLMENVAKPTIVIVWTCIKNVAKPRTHDFGIGYSTILVLNNNW